MQQTPTRSLILGLQRPKESHGILEVACTCQGSNPSLTGINRIFPQDTVVDSSVPDNYSGQIILVCIGLSGFSTKIPTIRAILQSWTTWDDCHPLDNPQLTSYDPGLFSRFCVHCLMYQEPNGGLRVRRSRLDGEALGSGGLLFVFCSDSVFAAH